MRLLEWWSIPRRGWLIILLEFSVILGLSGWLVGEYLNNVYFQGYVNSVEPTIIPILSVAFGIASGSIAVILYFNSRSIRRVMGKEILGTSRRNAHPRRSTKKTVPSESRPSKPQSATPASAPKLRPIAALRTNPSRQGPDASVPDRKGENND